jgi:hypothetical protein
VSLSHNASSDPDCDGSADGPLCEEHSFWWSEALMGLSYNDLNGDGEYTAGEPCTGNDDCLWSYDANGISPAVDTGDFSTEDTLTKRYEGNKGYITQLTVMDNYGADNESAAGFYVLKEPNTRAYAYPASDASSANEVGVEAQNNSEHYLPEGSSTALISVNTGAVSDADGDIISYTTTLTGDNGYSKEVTSGTCPNANNPNCSTGGFQEALEPDNYTVTTCAQDSYEGYEYLVYASVTNQAFGDTTSATYSVDSSIESTQNDPECVHFTFSVIAEPAAVDVNSITLEDQGMSYIAFSWSPSDQSVNGTNVAGLSELGENAVHYTVERTTTPIDTDSWSSITTLNVVREDTLRNCNGKSFDFENYSDSCEDPTSGVQASDDGEWYYMGRSGNSGDSNDAFHFLDEGLDADTRYYYRVFAINSVGLSSGIAQVFDAKTEGKPTMELSGTMAAEIYAVDDLTNTLTATFSAADDSAGHNVSSVTSSYSTYPDVSVNNATPFQGYDGENVDGPNSVDFTYVVTAWETDHSQSIEVCFEDAGDFWGFDKEGGCQSTSTFTGSEEALHHPYTYSGWHVFGSPMYKPGTTYMVDLFSDGLGDYSAGNDYQWFTQSGGFAADEQYNFGQAYFLGLNPELVSFVMSGEILSSADDGAGLNDLSRSTHDLSKGWNLISSKIVRHVNKSSMGVSDSLGNYTWAEARTLGIVSGEVLGTNEAANFESETLDPWTGYWIHASKSCLLTVAPHAFDDLAKDDIENDYMVWK